MAHTGHLEKLHNAINKSDFVDWNQWRDEHSEIKPDLSRACLENADLENANLTKADLQFANLTGANLGDFRKRVYCVRVGGSNDSRGLSCTTGFERCTHGNV